MSTVLLQRITLGEVVLRDLEKRAVSLPGAIRADAAALAYCAANGVDLARANLSGCDFDGADISGLWAPKSDCKGSTFRGVTASRLVNGRACELSAAQLQDAIITSDAFTHANLACCGAPAVFRVEPGPSLHLRGIDWSQCPDVIELPVARRERDRIGRVIALRSDAGWRVHAGERGVLPEAEAKVTLAARPEYTAAIAYLDSPECAQRKAEIGQRVRGVAEPGDVRGSAQRRV